MQEINPNAEQRARLLSLKPSPFYGVGPKTLRFCESCKSHKPHNGQPKVKGWKCKDCKSL